MPLYTLQRKDLGVCKVSMNINSNYTAFFNISPKPDSEWQQIIDKLWNVFGIRSSGSKSLDKQKLHELELRQAEKESSVSSKFLTVTKAEQERIQARKKAKNAENNNISSNSTQGAEILGKQIFLAIQMKQEQDVYENKKKRDNKYQS